MKIQIPRNWNRPAAGVGAVLALAVWLAPLPARGGDGNTITKAGDTLIFPAKQLQMTNNKLVADPAAPGGGAVESGGLASNIVRITTPPVPAGRYRVTARIAVQKHVMARYVGQFIANSGAADHQVNDVTTPFSVESFSKAGEYKDFSLELIRPPTDHGKMELLIRIFHRNTDVPVRVAQIEVKALSIPPVLVHKVWPEKLLSRCRASQPITVGLSNITPEPRNGMKLRLELISGLNEVTTIGTRSVNLNPYESIEIVFPWKTGDQEYGYEARAVLIDSQGKNVSQLSDYFAVSQSHFKLRIIGTGDSERADGVFPWLDQATLERGAMQLRLSYGNYLELYAWAPSSLVELDPHHRFWSSGQVPFWRYDRDALKAWIAEMHRLGVWMTVYNISWYAGWPGLEFMRQHPEYCAFDAEGRPGGLVDTAYWPTPEVAHGDDKPPPALPIGGEAPNYGQVWPVDDKLMNLIADEIIRAQQNLGFDGVRWDGHPIVYVLEGPGGILGTGFGSMIYNYEGKSVLDLIPGRDRDKQSLHNMQLIKKRVRKAAPDFEWGYNAGYDLSAEQMPKTWREITGNAGIWVEGGFRSGDEGVSDPSNTWAKYIEKLYLSSQLVIRSGGYPIHGSLWADSAITRHFLYGLFLAQGSHVVFFGEIASWGAYTDYSRFATRYCAYLFDPSIHPWWGYPDVHVTGWIQWEDRNASKIPPLADEVRIQSARPVFAPEKMLFHREVSKTEQDTILHLFNNPVKPYVDYAEIAAPPVQENIGISLRIPQGMNPRQAWCLSPDAWPMERELKVEPDGEGWVKLTVPRLETWDVIVVNWRKP